MCNGFFQILLFTLEKLLTSLNAEFVFERTLRKMREFRKSRERKLREHIF